MDKIAAELLKIARELTAKEDIEQVSKRGEFTLYLVKDDGVVKGFLRKGKDTKTEETPWQAFTAIVGQGTPRLGKLIGSFFKKDGGKGAALKALKRGY